VAQTNGTRLEFVFSEVFTFAGDLVRQLDTYHVWLRQPEPAEA
jgi:hypothetical protein